MTQQPPEQRAYYHEAIEKVLAMRKIDLANAAQHPSEKGYYWGRAHRCDDILFWLHIKANIAAGVPEQPPEVPQREPQPPMNLCTTCGHPQREHAMDLAADHFCERDSCGCDSYLGAPVPPVGTSQGLEAQITERLEDSRSSYDGEATVNWNEAVKEICAFIRTHDAEREREQWLKGFELAHELQACGHSRGDCRDSNYNPDSEICHSQCIGCERERALKNELGALERALREKLEGLAAEWQKESEEYARLASINSQRLQYSVSDGYGVRSDDLDGRIAALRALLAQQREGK